MWFERAEQISPWAGVGAGSEPRKSGKVPDSGETAVKASNLSETLQREKCVIRCKIFPAASDYMAAAVKREVLSQGMARWIGRSFSKHMVESSGGRFTDS
jgi:hypothetical protein